MIKRNAPRIADVMWRFRRGLPPTVGAAMCTLFAGETRAMLAVPVYRFDLRAPRIRAPHEILALAPATGLELGRQPPEALRLPPVGEDWVPYPRLFRWSMGDWSIHYEALAILCPAFDERRLDLERRELFAAEIVGRTFAPLAGPLAPLLRSLGEEFFEWLGFACPTLRP